jgi:prepilin-type processing-associated H-X9-DG protein
VDLEKDVIDSLGDQWAYFTDPTIGGSGLASITIVNRLKDPARFETSLSRIEDFALKLIEQQMGGAGPQIHLAFETVKIDDMTVHYLAVPLVAPCWVVANGTLYCAAFPQVAAAAARRGSDSGSSILQNPAFTAMKTRLGHPEVTGFGFADLPRTAPNAYGSWLMITRLSGFADLFGVKSPSILLPELGKLLGHLSPAGSVKWVDAEGAHIRSVEPFPASTLVASDPAITAIYAEPVLVSIMLPALSKAREQASRVTSMNNLRQIGLGCIMYANNHNGRFPPDLETLVQQEDLTAAVFSNPRAPHGPPPPPADRKEMARWVKDNSDYTYVGAGKKIDAGADTIIAYEKPDQATDGINIVFADGHVEWVEMPRARTMIQNAK